MAYDVGTHISRASVTEEPSLSPSLSNDSMWQINLRTSNEAVCGGIYPERPGEPDCSYYIRTGLCRFGSTCRFNHPANRNLAMADVIMQGEYPERIGQPECQYYLRTGTCKFGATCKFHHPRDKAGIAERVSLNTLGYPLRPNEMECDYYLKTGQCKFGNTCKFHHPQPVNMMVPFCGSPVYPSLQSPTTTQHSYMGGIANWPGASFIASPRWQGPSSPLLLSQRMVSIPSWNAFNGQLGSVSPSFKTAGNSQTFGSSHQSDTMSVGSQGPISPYRSSTVPFGFYGLQRENIYPERPGQPDCQFYMKTGDCKFGAVCKFHHPRDRLNPLPDCLLSPIGLPLRHGEPMCLFYSRYGICKFGPSCKFNHPTGIFGNNLSPSFSFVSPARLLFTSHPEANALALSSDGLVEGGPRKAKDNFIGDKAHAAE
ncbi:hypothetical protein SAY87_020024 [Trapa incisa]|uniref:C3H1-type domain-containing protein n=1 Tax=Trapa incisa TaxID=236973 RepID=A0AAN7K6Q6_9MYRT|nr:hypothetical protein SAY87_020024 [Trapa incisa]